MKISTLTIAVFAGLLPALVEGQLSLRYFNCEVGAACRDGDSHGTFDKYPHKTLFDCADDCDDDGGCYG
jgi:hypothetical protein